MVRACPSWPPFLSLTKQFCLNAREATCYAAKVKLEEKFLHYREINIQYILGCILLVDCDPIHVYIYIYI